MSNAIYPSLPGETYPIVRTPTFSTIIQQSANGMETRAVLFVNPLSKWEIPYSFVSSNDAAKTYFMLYGFFGLRFGKWDSFLFNDSEDNNSVTSNGGTPSQFGTGDGTTTQFQIGRVMGGLLEPIHAVHTINSININGTPTGSYTISSSGLITFSGAPGGGAVLTADFTYYWRCRFDEDSIDFENFVQHYFEVKKVVIYQTRDLT